MSAIDTARSLARDPSPPLPGSGDTWTRLRTLAADTRRDISVGRLLEAHRDAEAILRDLGDRQIVGGEFWGVWAAESSTTVLTASDDGAGGWTLTGTKPWCSGAVGCTHALITARRDAGRAMFVVEPTHPSVTVGDDDWHATGMAATRTHSLTFDATPAVLVADADAYLHRPGFWHGAVGVAACWFGGAQLVADRLRLQSKTDDLTLMHLGAVDTALWSGAATLKVAADEIDACPDDLVLAHAIALRVRAHIEHVAGEVVERVGRCLGPGPLVSDAAHGQAVADLTVYVRQSHAEHDLRALGALVLEHTDDQIGAP